MIHPAADDAMFQAVSAVVEAMAPRPLKRVVKSVMAALPPA